MGSLFEGPKVSNAATNRALKDLDKQSQRIRDSLKPIGINAGGLRSRFDDSTISINASGDRTGLVRSIADRFLEQAGLTADLRAKVAPGLSDLRRVRLQEIEDARRASISNLRDNLARRRVLGSSFGADAETRAELEFARERERVQAESFLQEIDLTNQFIAQEFDLARQSFATSLSELNLQADLAANLIPQATQALTASAQLQSQLAMQRASTTANLGIAQAEMDAKAQAGAGQFIGKVAGVALAPFTGGASLALAT